MTSLKLKKPTITRIQAYLTEENRAAFKRAARKYERTESDLARLLIENFLRHEVVRERQAGAKQDGQ